MPLSSHNEHTVDVIQIKAIRACAMFVQSVFAVQRYRVTSFSTLSMSWFNYMHRNA